MINFKTPNNFEQNIVQRITNTFIAVKLDHKKVKNKYCRAYT